MILIFRSELKLIYLNEYQFKNEAMFELLQQANLGD